MVTSERVVNFLEAIEALSREHGLSLSHEDRHGGFIVERLNEYNIEWLRAASDRTEKRG